MPSEPPRRSTQSFLAEEQKKEANLPKQVPSLQTAARILRNDSFLSYQSCADNLRRSESTGSPGTGPGPQLHSSSTPEKENGAATNAGAYKDIERALRESEDRYRDLVENCQELLCTHDLQGRLLWINPMPARLLGYRPEELIGRSIQEGLVPEFRNLFPEYLERIQRDSHAEGLMVVLTRTGERRVWEYHNTLRTEGVESPIVRGMAHDITERKRAEAILQHREATIRSLFQTCKRLTVMHSVSAILKAVVLEGIELASAEGGYCGIRNEKGLVSDGVIFGSPARNLNYCWPPGVGLPGWVLLHKRPYVCSDAARDKVILPELRDLISLRDAVAIPVFDVRGEVGAFFELHNKKRRGGFTPLDVESLQALAQVASVAPQNAFAYRKVHRAEEELRSLSAQLLRLQDEERRSLARELHDTAAQSLVALRMNLERLKRAWASPNAPATEILEESLHLVESSTQEIRTLSYLLYPPMLEEAGLASAIGLYADGFAGRSGIRVDLEIPPDFGRLQSDLELTIFRVVQECLMNIHRHAESPSARIRLAREGRLVVVEVEDQGRGMPGGAARSLGRRLPLGVGIAGMSERVRQLEGKLEIDSVLGRGTRVRASMPAAVTPAPSETPAPG